MPVTPLVTIGIPTYARPETLARCLASVAAQDYPDLEVLVSDNASPTHDSAEITKRFSSSISRLSYTRHSQNVGPIGNFLYLLRCAKGEYFMWLADDDEISANYVSSLVEVLERDTGVASAAGHWVLRRDGTEDRLMPTSSFPQRSRLARALRFVWRSDDAFFYAVHRTSILRQARFEGYWWPNRDMPTNWAYVYLLDVVLRGRVLLAADPSVQFINYAYTPKAYPSRRGSTARLAAFLGRRVNVHYLYWAKCFRKLGLLPLPLIVGTSLASLIREALVMLARGSARI